MSRSADWVRLRHMLDAARMAVDFVSARDAVDRDFHPIQLLGLEKLVENIGEAASRLSPAIAGGHLGGRVGRYAVSVWLNCAATATGTRRSRLGGQVEQAATLRLVHGRTVVGDPGEDDGDQRAAAK